MISERIEAFLASHPVGSLVRPEDAAELVFRELIAQGHLEPFEDHSGFGYPLRTYVVVHPNGQTNTTAG